MYREPRPRVASGHVHHLMLYSSVYLPILFVLRTAYEYPYRSHVCTKHFVREFVCTICTNMSDSMYYYIGSHALEHAGDAGSSRCVGE